MFGILTTCLVVILISAVISSIPAFHIYNQLAILTACLYFLPLPDFFRKPEIVVTIFSTLLVGYIYFVNIPSVLFSAPDDSTFFTTPIAGKFLEKGDAISAIMMSSFGSSISLILLFILIPFVGDKISTVNTTLRPHFGWILWCIIIYIIISEWPKVYSHQQGGLAYLLKAWFSCFGGLLTFALAGILGILILRTGVLNLELNFIKLMPAFIGLFTIPGMLHNIYVKYRMPKQNKTVSELPNKDDLFYGIVPGIAGGAFAALLPGVTAGVAGMLAGQSTNLTNEKSILVSQGASRVVYYIGAMLLFFPMISGVNRGGMSHLLRINNVAQDSSNIFFAAGASMLIAGAVAILILPFVFRVALKVIEKLGSVYISVGVILLAAVAVTLSFGFNGLVVLLTATAIGTLPNQFGCRRINCLGIILLPLAIVL